VIFPFNYFNATPKIKNCKQAAHFAKRNTKFGGGESEGGAGIHFPHTPFSSRPARASRILFKEISRKV